MTTGNTLAAPSTPVVEAWTSAARIRVAGGAPLALASFRGRIVSGPGGAPEPDLVAERGLTLDALMDDGLLDDPDGLLAERPGDAVALGVNFSRLYRSARLLEATRARAYLEQANGAIESRIAETGLSEVFAKESAARRLEEEKERAAEYEAQVRHRAAREAAAIAAQAAAREAAMKRLEDLCAKAGFVAPPDVSLDLFAVAGSCSTPKPFESDWGARMAEPFVSRGPFAWVRLMRGDRRRVFFDKTGARVAEPGADAGG